MKTNVLILCGGKSDEHEISLISAKCVLDAIDRNRFHPIVIGISRKGIWHLEDEKTFFTGEFRADKIKLNTKAPTISVMPFTTPQGRGCLVSGNQTTEFDVVFPVLHGPFGEDGTIQGLLDIAGIPYVGANCESSAVCRDKALTKTICLYHNIPVTEFVLVRSLDDTKQKMEEINRLGGTWFVKPARLGSSVGVTKVTDSTKLLDAVESALTFDSKVLIERAVKAREIETALLGLASSARVAVPGEIIPSKKVGWYTYEAKYLMPDGAEVVVPAKLSAEDAKRVQQFALNVFQTLECDGMARIDLFLEEGTNKIYLNEVNTIPGFTPISMYPKMWQASGLSYSQLITELLELAKTRLAKLPRTQQ